MCILQYISIHFLSQGDVLYFAGAFVSMYIRTIVHDLLSGVVTDAYQQSFLQYKKKIMIFISREHLLKTKPSMLFKDCRHNTILIYQNQDVLINSPRTFRLVGFLRKHALQQNLVFNVFVVEVYICLYLEQVSQAAVDR